MDYKYRCQHIAENFARTILPVPDDYPVKKGLPNNFRQQFAKLCDLAKRIYLDMAEKPEDYGLQMIDIEANDTESITKSAVTIHRVSDTLNVLFLSGELQNHFLIVSADIFRKSIKAHLPESKKAKSMEIRGKSMDFRFQASVYIVTPNNCKMRFCSTVGAVTE